MAGFEFGLGSPMGQPLSADQFNFGMGGGAMTPTMTPTQPLYQNPVAPVSPMRPKTNPFTQTNPAGGQQQGWLGKLGGLEGIANLMDGITSLGQVYTAMQGMKLAKEQLGFQKEAYQTNLANQTQSYNTTLEDRIRSRYVTEGKGAGEADAYLAKHSL